MVYPKERPSIQQYIAQGTAAKGSNPCYDKYTEKASSFFLAPAIRPDSANASVAQTSIGT